MDKKLIIDGVEFELLVEQRTGTLIYRARDRYLRLGEKSVIAKDVETHKKMEGLGFPVAAIIGSGTLGTQDYFIERSVGERRFRDLFEGDMQKHGAISHEHFSQFVDITERYLMAQAKAIVAPDPTSFTDGIHLDILREELPQYAHSLKDKVGRILHKLSAFPFVLTHGDFNPANMYPLGIIDLEDSFSAPFGFDAVSAVSTIECFPDSPEYEFYARYRFTPEQKRAYLEMCDKVSTAAGYPAVSLYYDDFAFCRAVWSLVRMHKWPKLQAWRYNNFIKTYLFQ